MAIQENPPPLNLDEVMGTWGTAVLKSALFCLKDRMLAEDIYQEVFIRLHKAWPSLKHPVNMKAWLLTVTMNLCRDHVRKWSWSRLWYTSDSAVLEKADRADPGSLLSQKEHDTELLRAVMSLPFLLRQSIYLYYYEELNTIEISELLQVSTVTVRSRLFRAKKALRDILEKGSEEHE